jgi:hypothetical protein
MSHLEDVYVPGPEVQATIRKIVREEIASMAGLVLRRAQEENYTRDPERNIAIDVTNDTFARIFGEVLADFSGHTKGEEPGA